MFNRSVWSIVERFAKIYPIISITGPRQSGKTTLAQALFSHFPYINLENLDIRLQAQNDPRAFLARYHDGAIFDEVQHVPELLSYLQQIVDESPQKGRYVVTGSQNFVISEQISQSLSGRIGMLTLLPLSMNELNFESTKFESVIFRGGYPGLYQRNMNPTEFFPSYIQTYLERDVRQIKNIEDLGLFQTFIKLCAGRIGQVINYSSLAQDCGISHTTVYKWLTVLQASYILFLLQPFHKNFSKRLVKKPKLYFYDTGLACSLLGLEQESQVETHYLKGSLYENLVVLELLKARLNKGLLPNLYFWRDLAGHEVDLIAEWGGSIKAIEIKAGATLQPNFVKNVNYFCSLSPESKGYVLYPGQEGFYANTTLLPIRSLQRLLDE
ncbi:MAG TPA: ATP-binding protein [Candidatus Babeliales bacterium]|nr:ATP-binding protein [Candidatus Babeliales bacterium]